MRLAAPGGATERAHDAGEPAGTAGPPILAVLRGARLVNALVVVSRYFGGTKLGKGGLARAYREAAGAALAGAGTSETTLTIGAVVGVALSLDGAVRNLVARHGGAIAGAAYTETEAHLTVVVPAESFDRLREAVEGLARGRARIAVDPAGPPPAGATPDPPRSGRRRH